MRGELGVNPRLRKGLTPRRGTCGQRKVLLLHHRSEKVITHLTYLKITGNLAKRSLRSLSQQRRQHAESLGMQALQIVGLY